MKLIFKRPMFFCFLYEPSGGARGPMCVCMFSMEIQTPGWILMKFGTEVVLEGGKVLGGFF